MCSFYSLTSRGNVLFFNEQRERYYHHTHTHRLTCEDNQLVSTTTGSNQSASSLSSILSLSHPLSHSSVHSVSLSSSSPRSLKESIETQSVFLMSAAVCEPACMCCSRAAAASLVSSSLSVLLSFSCILDATTTTVMRVTEERWGISPVSYYCLS